MDLAIDLVHAAGGEQAIQRDLPASLKTKLAYFRAIPRKISGLSHTSDIVQAFVDGMQAVKDDRHDLTHGMIRILDEGYKIQVTRFRYSGAKLTATAKEIGQRQINSTVQSVVQLNYDVALIAAAFAKALGNRESEDAFGDLAVSAAFAIEVSNNTRTVVD